MISGAFFIIRRGMAYPKGMNAFPSPEQLAAMAREYSKVRPMDMLPKPHAEWQDIARHISRLNALLLPLRRVPNHIVVDLAEDALDAVSRMQAQIAALDGGESDGVADVPYARNVADLLRQALLANAALCHELYREREGRSLAAQLPYLASLAHYTHSLLLTLAAI